MKTQRAGFLVLLLSFVLSPPLSADGGLDPDRETLRPAGLEESSDEVQQEFLRQLSGLTGTPMPIGNWDNAPLPPEATAGLEEGPSQPDPAADFPSEGLVEIHTRVPVPQRLYSDERLQRMVEKRGWPVNWKTRTLEAEGSGIVFHEDSRYYYLLSAHHVIKPIGPAYEELGFQPSYEIALLGGTKLSAEYLGSAVGVGNMGTPYVGLLRIKKADVPPDSIQVIPLADASLLEEAFRSPESVRLGGYMVRKGKAVFVREAGKIIPRGDPIYKNPLGYPKTFILAYGESNQGDVVGEEYVAVQKDKPSIYGADGGVVLYKGRVIGVIGWRSESRDGDVALSISVRTIRILLQAIVDDAISKGSFENLADADAKTAFAEALRLEPTVKQLPSPIAFPDHPLKDSQGVFVGSFRKAWGVLNPLLADLEIRSISLNAEPMSMDRTLDDLQIDLGLKLSQLGLQKDQPVHFKRDNSSLSITFPVPAAGLEEGNAAVLEPSAGVITATGGDFANPFREFLGRQRLAGLLRNAIPSVALINVMDSVGAADGDYQAMRDVGYTGVYLGRPNVPAAKTTETLDIYVQAAWEGAIRNILSGVPGINIVRDIRAAEIVIGDIGFDTDQLNPDKHAFLRINAETIRRVTRSLILNLRQQKLLKPGAIVEFDTIIRWNSEEAVLIMV